MSKPDCKQDTIFYDGACPLCSAEMKKLADCADNTLELADIHHLGTAKDLPSKDQLLARLHVRTADGEWLYGVDANVRAWQHTPYARFWRILVWPVFKPFTLLGYEIWLRWRAWRSH